ncbi:hypothetical protein [Streptomyces sp. NBC_01022]|uniref:hypothetical protein n=1 Tax=Streptomyces sp. NBC_01022 TaxID=2903723 RepID=UPI002DD8C693|nr:hypothetical protein [Streptomyces sp. NBC_01022]WRZ79516.1 hypothetical protein OG316_04165 [Streptomyces sp. NBC_01022]WRZ86159.1 hypothetical protein OG316_40725 [Streptomyces sp. NBC_01022]
MRDVRLEWLAAEVMEGLPSSEARAEVEVLLTDVAARPEWWPRPGGEEVADAFGVQCWVSFVAYLDGVEVRDVGWAG